MTRQDLIDTLAGELGPKVARKATIVFFDTITQALVDNRMVELRGFGTFIPRRHAPRARRDPRTGEALPALPATRHPHYRAAKAMNQAIQPKRGDV